MPRVRLVIALLCAWVCGAQPAAPPKVLVLVRQQFKPTMSQARERMERANAAACNRLDVPAYWLDLQAFTGTPQAVLFEPFDSFEAVEKARAALPALFQAHPELARLEAGINDSLASERTILAVRRETPGQREINLAEARFLRMIVVQGAPGTAKPSIEGPASSVVYDVASGMHGPASLIFQAMTDFKAPQRVAIASGTIAEDSIYVIDPRMSHVSRAFAEQDASFWERPAGQP